MLDWLGKRPVTKEDDDDDDEYTLRDLASEVADLGRTVDGLLKREQRRDAAERQQRSRERRTDGGSVESGIAPIADAGPRVASQSTEQEVRNMSPSHSALWQAARRRNG